MHFEEGHHKPKAPGTKQSQFDRKHKPPNKFLHRNFKRQNPFCMFGKEKCHTKEQCWKLQRKEHDNKNKVTNHNGQFLDVLEVYTHYLSSCKCSFPHYALGPNNLLHANGYINGSQVQFLFHSGSSHNKVNDFLVQIRGIQPIVSDHIPLM